MNKECSRCKDTKSLDDFGKDANSDDGLRHLCNGCYNWLKSFYGKEFYAVIKKPKIKKPKPKSKRQIQKEFFSQGLRECYECGEIKKLSDFSKEKARPDGYTTVCKKCDNIRRRRYPSHSSNITEEEKERRREHARKWRKLNPSKKTIETRKRREQRIQQREKLKKEGNSVCSKCKKIKPFSEFGVSKNNYDGCSSSCKECTRAHNERNREHNTNRMRKWRDKNRDHVREYMNKYATERRKNDPYYKMDTYFRARFIQTLKSKNMKTKKILEDILGYTIDEFVAHMERQWLPGMSWDNHSFDGWHIDHKIPVSSLPYDTIDHPNFKKCWALENLQPLWAKDNFSKGNKII